jgi:hypothetical protein
LASPTRQSRPPHPRSLKIQRLIHAQLTSQSSQPNRVHHTRRRSEHAASSSLPFSPDQRPLQRRPWRRRRSSTRCSSARATATSGTRTSRTPSRPTSHVCTRPRTLPLHLFPVICAGDLGSDGFLVLEFLLLQTAASRCGGERPHPRRSPSLRVLSFHPLVFRRSAETYLAPHFRRFTRDLGDLNHGWILLHIAFVLFSCY